MRIVRRAERTGGERHRLSGGGTRVRAQHHVDGLGAVEGEHGVGDVAVRRTTERLDEIDVIGGDGTVQVDLDALAARVAEALGRPRRGEIAVERGDRPVLGPVRVGVAVGGRDDALHADVTRGGERRRLLAGEHVEARVAGIGRQRLVGRAGLLREPDGLGDRRPLACTQPVLVGDDQHVAGRGRAAQRVGARVRRRIAHHARAVEQPDARCVDETLAVSADHQPVVGGLAPHDRGGVRDRVHHHGRDGAGGRRSAEADLVGVARRKREQRRGPVSGGCPQAGRGREHGREIDRSYEVVPLVVDVVARHDVADAHPPPQRDERGGIGDPDLQPAIDGVQEIGAPGGAVRDQLARDVRPIGEAGRDRVDGVAPGVRREVGAGHFEDARLVVAAVESGDRLCPVGRERLVALQVLAVEGAVDQRGEVHEDEHADEHRHRVREHDPPPPPQPAEDGVRRQSEEHRERQHDERRGAPGTAQREAGRRRVRERLEQRTERSGAVVGMRADADDDAHEEQEHEEDAVAPARERGGEQREHDEAVAGEDDVRVLRVVARGLDPRAEAVLPVEEPVAQAPQHLVGRGGQGNGLDRLAVLQHVEPVRALHAQAGHPPQRGEHREAPGAQRDPDRAARVDLARDEPRVQDPQHRSEAGVDQRGRVDATDHLHDQREDRGIAPALLAQRLADDRDHPGQRRPRHEQDRDARRVVEDVGRAHVGERGDDETRPAQPERAQEVQARRARPRTARSRARAVARPMPANRASRGASSTGPSGTRSRSSGG